MSWKRGVTKENKFITWNPALSYTIRPLSQMAISFEMKKSNSRGEKTKEKTNQLELCNAFDCKIQWFYGD